MHLLNRMDGRTKSLLFSGANCISTGGHVALRGGRLTRQENVRFGKYEVFFILHSASNNNTTVYISSDYRSLFSSWTIVDRVLELHGGEVPIDNLPGDDVHSCKTTFQFLRCRLLGRADFFLKIWFSRKRLMLRATSCALKNRIQILRNRKKLLWNMQFVYYDEIQQKKDKN